MRWYYLYKPRFYLGVWACVREAVEFAMKKAYHTLLYLSTLSEIRAFRNVISRLHCAPAAVPLPENHIPSKGGRDADSYCALVR